MNNLQNIFLRKDEIIALSKKFGFTNNVRVFFGHYFEYESPSDGNPGFPKLKKVLSPMNLSIYVEEIEGSNVSFENSGWLSSKLSELFQSDIEVTDIDSVKEYIKKCQ